MEFGQEYKKRIKPGGDGPGNNSTFETSSDGEAIEIPDIEGIMGQIDKNLRQTRDIVVEDRTMESGPCGC